MSPRLERTLTGSPPKSTTWIRILDNGDFEVEYYDYLNDEDSPFSSDYGVINRVKSEHKPLLKKLLSGNEALSDEELLEAVVQKFPHRSDIEDWCKANDIPCEHIYDQFA